MPRYQGCKISILLFYINTLLLSVNLSADNTTAPTGKSAHDSIEEGWVEKQISPPTKWVESIFAPLTQWMENKIQQESPPPPASANHLSHSLITVQQAIDVILKKYPGKILRSQFKPGPPPYYKIKFLSNEGSVTILYVHAFSAKLFTPIDIEVEAETVKP